MILANAFNILLAGAVGSILTISSIDHVASPATLEANVTRGDLCAEFLRYPGRTDDVDRSSRGPSVGASNMPGARVYVGHRDEMDAETAQLWRQAGDHAVLRRKAEGEYAIRKVLDAVQARGSSIPNESDSSLDTGWATYRNFVITQYATELASFDRLLDDYAAGKNLDATIVAVVPAAARDPFSTYAFKLGASHFYRGEQPEPYCWHQLSWDKAREIPVWRYGWSRF